MLENEIRTKVESAFDDGEVNLMIEGNRLTIRVISSLFHGLNAVKRQQRVYACINQWLASGEIHAISIEAKTPDEI